MAITSEALYHVSAATQRLVVNSRSGIPEGVTAFSFFVRARNLCAAHLLGTLERASDMLKDLGKEIDKPNDAASARASNSELANEK